MAGPDRIWAFYSNIFGAMWTVVKDEGADEYIRADTVAEMVRQAVNDATSLHLVISAIREATVGVKPMLSDLPAALLEWRQAAVDAARAAARADYEARSRVALNVQPQPITVAQAAQTVAQALKDGEVWRVAVNAASAILNSGMPQEYWTRPTEIRKALDDALRAIEGGVA